MKSSFDLKHNLGKITPENPDDLWILSEIITPGSLVKAKTLRSVEIRRGEKKLKAGKRGMTLKISVEKIELTDRLRLGGKIVEGPEEVPHDWHTLEIEPRTFLSIEKEWKKWEIDRIKAAAVRIEPVHVAILDDREYDLYYVTDKNKHLLSIKGPGYAKGEKITMKPQYFGEIISDLKRRDIKHIIMAGPGFIKDEIMNTIKSREKELLKKVILESCSHTGDLGLNELIRKGVLQKVVKSSRVEKEAKLVEQLLEGIAKNGNVTYGQKEVKKAAKAGAVDILLISDKKVRDNEETLDLVGNAKGKVMIISSQHPAGEHFFEMGGIGAILRYKITG